MLGGGETIANTTTALAMDLADTTLAPSTSQALYVNTQRWLRRHGLTEVSLSVPSFGLDDAAQTAADSALALDTRLAYLPNTLQATSSTHDLASLLGAYLPSGSSASYSVVSGGNLVELTDASLDLTAYPDGAQVQAEVETGGISVLESVLIIPVASPVTVSLTLNDVENASHVYNLTASDGQGGVVESLTTDIVTVPEVTIGGTPMLVVQADGEASLLITAQDASWQQVVHLEVLAPRTAPSITWSLNNSGDLQVSNITGDSSNVTLTYQGTDSSLTLMTVLPVDRAATDSIEWVVTKDGVNYSTTISVDVVDVVNPLALDNLTARVADNSISDAELLTQFVGLEDVSTDATVLGLYRSELANNPVTSITELQSTIASVNSEANAFIDLQTTPASSITIAQIQTLLPGQYLADGLLTEYRAALADNTWTTPDEVRVLIVAVNNDNAVDSDGDGIFDGEEIAQFSDPQDA
ncbi:hypothetical protein UB34_20675, partial [Photobacterium leiognathi]